MRLLLRTIAFMLAVLLFSAGCGSWDRQPGRVPEQVPEQMPEQMPEDFNFSVRFGITSKNEINTFRNEVTKDLIMNGTATTSLAFTREEMQHINDRMREINVLRELETDSGETGCGMIPHDEEHWVIELNGVEKQFHWSEEPCKITEDARMLRELRKHIWEIVQRKDAYRKLPEPAGAYE